MPVVRQADSLPLELYIGGDSGTHQPHLVFAIPVLFSRPDPRKAGSIYRGKETAFEENMDIRGRFLGIFHVAVYVGAAGIHIALVGPRTALGSNIDRNSRLCVGWHRSCYLDVLLDRKKAIPASSCRRTVPPLIASGIFHLPAPHIIQIQFP